MTSDPTADAPEIRATARLEFDAETHASGLACVRLELADPPPGPLTLTVRPPGLPAQSFELSEEARARRITLALHTHRLDNGERTVGLELRAGAASWTGELRLRVENDTALAGAVRESLARNDVPFAVLGTCDAGDYDYADAGLQPWFDRPDAHDHVAARLERGELDAEQARLLHEFVDQGYVVLEGLFDDELVDQVNAEIDAAIGEGYQGYEWGSSQRIEHLHFHKPGVRKMWLDPRYLRFLDLVFEAPARPCQTLVFVFGSQQDAHQDTVHLTPFPAGYMCGVWIALQDVEPDSGELVVYPGSHRFPRIRMGEVGCPKVTDGDWSRFGEAVGQAWWKNLSESGIEPYVYRPKKGTALIWHENLMHGGSPRKDPTRTRRSLVIHAFADGALVFYDSTGEVGHALPRSQRDG